MYAVFSVGCPWVKELSISTAPPAGAAELESQQTLICCSRELWGETHTDRWTVTRIRSCFALFNSESVIVCRSCYSWRIDWKRQPRGHTDHHREIHLPPQIQEGTCTNCSHSHTFIFMSNLQFSAAYTRVCVCVCVAEAAGSEVMWEWGRVGCGWEMHHLPLHAGGWRRCQVVYNKDRWNYALPFKSILMLLKEVCSAHQGCIYLIKHTVKSVILWNIITI